MRERAQFRVAAHACGPNKRMRVPDLIRELQEVALASTLRLGVSVYDLEPHRLGWVLLGQYVQLERAPEMNETCTVHTCPTGFERVFTFRDFHVMDEEGNRIAVASTTWMLMDLDKRRMARLPDWIKALDANTPPPEEQLPRAEYQLLPVDNAERVREFTVGFKQLDTNGHLTNPFYPEWMLEGLPYEVLANHELKELRLQFKREARYGDRLTVTLDDLGQGVFRHGLWQENEQLATMETKWDKSVTATKQRKPE